jgi:putative aminopeptidase FrvX
MFRKTLGTTAAVLLLAVNGMGKSDLPSLNQLVEALFPIPSPTGYEHNLAREIRDILPGKAVLSQDNLGSLYMAPAAGSPRMAVLTGMDEIGYVVSGITDDGYLTLDRGVRPSHSLYDTYQFGHPVRIWTRKGLVNGVWALPSSHTLSRARRTTLMQELSLEHAYIDIGAGSRESAELRGIAYLDPVMPVAEIHTLAGGLLSGPALGSKACAAVVLDLAGKGGSGSSLDGVQFAWLAQTKLMRRTGGRTVAVGALRAQKDIQARELIVVDIFPCSGDGQADIRPGQGPVLAGISGDSALAARIQGVARESAIPLQEAPEFASAVLAPFQGGERDAVALLLPVQFPATPSEVIRTIDLEALQRLLYAAAGQEGVR